MGDYVILFSPVGSGLSAAVDNLQCQPDCAVQDIEETLKRAHQTKDKLRTAYPQIRDDFTMEDIIYYLPRPEVVKLWRSSAKQCLSDLQASSASLKVLAGHMVYYSGRRNTFYSAVDSKVLKPQGSSAQTDQLAPSAIAVLIDDVYDMFARLRPSGQLFCDNRIADFLKMTCGEHDISIPELSKTENLTLVLSWKLNSLTRLLAWRSLEIVMAAHLAIQLGIDRLMVFAAKQRLSAMREWFANTNSPSVYVSHPISGPRKEQKRTRCWPDVIDEINALQLLLLKHSLVGIMPTGIDEYRFAGSGGILQYSGRLSQRWPLPQDTAREPVIYQPPQGGQAPHYCETLYPGFYNSTKRCLESRKRFKEPVLTSLRNATSVLAGRITEQVSSRDHLFVAHCDGLLVYRPFYGGKTNFSGGVQAEVDHWASLVASGVRKRCAFVHLRSEIENLLASASKDPTVPLSAAIRERIWPMLREKEGITNKRAMECLIKTGELPAGGVLDKTPRTAGEIEKRYPKLEREAKVSYLRDRLTGDHGDVVAESSIWIVDSYEKFRGILSKVAQFFQGQQDVDKAWKRDIENMLDDGLWKD